VDMGEVECGREACMLRLSQGGRRLIAMFEDLGKVYREGGENCRFASVHWSWLAGILLGSWVAKLVFSR
jgi:hypothetical protein